MHHQRQQVSCTFEYTGAAQTWTVPAIAVAVGADAGALRRLLHALTAVDVLREDDDGHFTATARGALLGTDHPQSLRNRALYLGAPFFWRPWGELVAAITTGTPAFDQVYGQSFFEHLNHAPHDDAVFHAAMSSGSRGNLDAILAAYDFAACTRIVDVGGGQGALLSGILEQYPHATGVLFDLPAVIAAAHAFRASPLAARCEFVSGSMFEAVPAGGDAYVLRHILHDWSDAEVLGILRNCRAAIADAGKLVVIDAILRPPNEPNANTWIDLTMLVMVTGRERTEPEFRALFAAAGFRLTRVSAAGPASVIEGVPV